jgi:hypothetical protein
MPKSGDEGYRIVPKVLCADVRTDRLVKCRGIKDRCVEANRVVFQGEIAIMMGTRLGRFLFKRSVVSTVEPQQRGANKNVHFPQLQAPCAQVQSAQLHPAVPQPGMFAKWSLEEGICFGKRWFVRCIVV